MLYTGVTTDLARRMEQHRKGQEGSFSARYNLNKLGFVELTDRINDAIAREKQIKAGSRQKKIDLIESVNPEWNDLYDEYFG